MASFDPQTALLVMALPDESGQLFENAGIQPLYTGIGQVKAAFALTKSLMQTKPALILNLGTAGSIDFPQGQCVECSAFVQRQFNSIGPKNKKILIDKALTNLPQVICGTADFIQETPFATNSEFKIMDMEAYALAFVAKQFQIPFYSVKFITDNSNENVVSDWKKNLAKARENLFSVYQQLQFKSSQSLP